MALLVKNQPAYAGDTRGWFEFLAQENPLEEDMTTHSSILAWRIPMDRGARRGRVHGVAKSWTRLKPLSTDTNRDRKRMQACIHD